LVSHDRLSIESGSSHVTVKPMSYDNSKQGKLAFEDFAGAQSMLDWCIRNVYVPGGLTMPGSQVAHDIADCYSSMFDQVLTLPNLRDMWPVALAYINAKMAYATLLRSKGHLKSHIEQFDHHEYHMHSSQYVLEQALEVRNGSSTGTSSSRSSGTSGRSFQAGNSNRSSKPSSSGGSGRSKCWVCGSTQHLGRSHTGSAPWLALDSQSNKWLDAKGTSYCITFNTRTGGCSRDQCQWQHSCSLCGKGGHGAQTCGAAQ
jgi:hypothetical protein